MTAVKPLHVRPYVHVLRAPELGYGACHSTGASRVCPLCMSNLDGDVPGNPLGSRGEAMLARKSGAYMHGERVGRRRVLDESLAITAQEEHTTSFGTMPLRNPPPHRMFKTLDQPGTASVHVDSSENPAPCRPTKPLPLQPSFGPRSYEPFCCAFCISVW